MGDVIIESLSDWFARADQDVEINTDFCMNFEIEGLTVDTIAMCEG